MYERSDIISRRYRKLPSHAVSRMDRMYVRRSIAARNNSGFSATTSRRYIVDTVLIDGNSRERANVLLPAEKHHPGTHVNIKKRNKSILFVPPPETVRGVLEQARPGRAQQLNQGLGDHNRGRKEANLTAKTRTNTWINSTVGNAK